MDLIEKAIVFAANAHDGQVRKGTSLPYISHPYAVGMYLQKANCSEEVIAAGILQSPFQLLNYILQFNLSKSCSIHYFLNGFASYYFSNQYLIFSPLMDS